MPESFADYIARTLAGTPISPITAPHIATGHMPANGTTAHALHDGYTAPDRAPQPTPAEPDTNPAATDPATTTDETLETP